MSSRSGPSGEFHRMLNPAEARIDESLGFPTHDPHGDPIPDANLEWPAGAAKRD